MLSDAASVSEGKLYVHGGGWDRIFTPSFPTTHPSHAIALLIEIAYDEALADHTLAVELIKDGEPLGLKSEARVRVGHAPLQTRGAPTMVPFALTFPMVTFPEAGRYEWVISCDGVPTTSLAVELTHAAPA